MKPHQLAASAAVTAGLVLSGCGSSGHTLSASAFGSAANKICGTVNSQSSAAAKNLTSSASAANGTALGTILSIEQNGVSKIKALKGPASLNAARDAFVAEVNKGEQAVQAAQSAAKSGNQTAYSSSIQQIGTIGNATDKLGAKLNAPECASDS